VTSPMATAAIERFAEELFAVSPSASLLLSLPAERIIAASPSAARLLDPSGASPAGKLLQSFASDRPTPGPGRVAGCRVDGGETFRVLRRPNDRGVGIRLWVRHIEGRSIGHVVLVMLRRTSTEPDEGVPQRVRPSVLGVTGADLVVQGIGPGGTRVFGMPVADLLGRRLVDLVCPADADECLAAWHEVGESGIGVAVSVDIASRAEPVTATRYELLLFPIAPAPLCAFVLMPSADEIVGPRRTHRAAELAPLLMQLAWAAEANHIVGSAFSGLSEVDLPGINQLTVREREITGRLIDGDRVPAIAAQLHLSQSTIRNHLTSVFSKFGVSSQQGLVDSFKSATLARL
jgi:DNA-binding CsgD family transcriptional regulator